VLLLDEPLGALDRKLRQEMQVELKLLQREVGITFIFVTHDQEEALSMSDRIAIMLDGHVEQLTDPDTIYEQPASAFVAAFIGQNNFWRSTTSNGTATTADGIVFSGARQVGTVPAAGDALVSIRPESISLAQAFGDSTGANAVVGTLAGVAHLGDVLQYVVRTPGNDVIVRLPRCRSTNASSARGRLVPHTCTQPTRQVTSFHKPPLPTASDRSDADPDITRRTPNDT
jgi:spermidine/putrescine transport system ATP-binding protein